MTDEQIKYDQDGKNKVLQWINKNGKDWQIQDSNWILDPIDFQITSPSKDSYIRYCEIKGRLINSDQYDDILIDRKKIDFINKKVDDLKSYGSYDVNGLIFYIFSDNVMAIIRTDILAANAEKIEKDCRKSKADSTIIKKLLYKMKLYNNDGSVKNDIMLIDLNTNKQIYKKRIILPSSCIKIN